jgi:glycosyltransferase involved in cell wall biosynthesis
MSAMEALAMEVPVIAPDYGPFPYLIENGVNGLLFKVDDVNDLRKKLKVICEDGLLSKLKLGAKEKNKEANLATNTYSSTINKIILN